MNVVGPSRMALINVGVYDFGVIRLDRPLHIVGRNNLGKTTLVNAFQFLYVDTVRHMRFGEHVGKETLRYYFPGDDNYVLFECLTDKGGFRTIGVRGKGPANGYELGRFAFDGQYRREDFLDEDDVPRRFDAVRSRLVDRNFAEFDPEHMRDALTGGPNDKGMGLGLLPLRNAGDYARFRKGFQNLLQLSRLGHDDLRQAILDGSRTGGEGSSVDIRERYADKLAEVRRHKHRTDALQRIEGTMRGLVSDLTDLVRTRADLWSRWFVLCEDLRLLEAEAVGAAARLRARGEAAVLAMGQARELLRVTAARRDAAVRHDAGIDANLRRLADTEEADGHLDVAIERAAGARYEAEYQAISLRIGLAGSESPSSIEATLARLRRRLAKGEDDLRNLDANVVAWLRRAGMPDDAIVSAFKVLNPGVMTLAVGRDIQVRDPALLRRRIEALLANVEGDSYRDDAVDVDLSRLLPDVPHAMDRAVLEAEVEDLRDQIRRQEARLVVARDMAGQRALAEGARAERDRAYANVAKADQLAGSRARKPAWDREKRELAVRREALDVEVGRIEADIERHRTEADATARQGDAEEKRAQSARLEVRSLPAPRHHDAAEEVPEPDLRGAAAVEFPAHASAYRRRHEKMVTLSSAVDEKVLQVEPVLDRLPRDRALMRTHVMGRLEALGAEVEGIRKLWTGFVEGLASGLRGLLEELERARSAVDALNRSLAGVSVSDLKRLRLEVREDPSLVHRLRSIVDTHSGGSVDLFADPAAYDKAAERIGDFIRENQTIRIEDLFTLSFVVERAGGTEQRYRDLSQIESNGTTMTIKVLVNLVLLQGLFRKGKPYQVPFYIDEANALDRDNLASVVDVSRRLGFVAILASPRASDIAGRFYHPESVDGRVVIPEPIEVNAKTGEKAA